MYYSTENFYIVGDLEEIRKNFFSKYSKEINELEKALKVIEYSEELNYCIYPTIVIHDRLDDICDEYPFLDCEKILEILRQNNVARLYEIDGVRIIETVPKLDFFKRPISNYEVFKVQEDYLKKGGSL